MKIGLLCPALEVCGGVQRIVTVLADAMADRHEVVVISVNNQSEKFFYPFRPEVKTICFNQFVFRKRDLLSGIIRKLERRFPVALPAAVARHVYFPPHICQKLGHVLAEERCDCIIASTPHCAVLLGLAAEYLTGVRLIGWQHSSYEIYYEVRGKGFYVQRELAKKAYRRLDHLVTLTEQDARAYEEKMGLSCSCIHNPLSFQSRRKSTVDQKKMIFVGDLLMHGGKVNLQNIPGADIRRYAESVIALENLEVEQFYSGHGCFSLHCGKEHIEKAAQAFKSLGVPPNFL